RWPVPSEHDRLMAVVSHVPQVVASALAGAIDEADFARAGPGLRDTTRIAASQPALWRDILCDNRSAVIAQLDEIRRQLDAFKDALDDEDAGGVEDLLANAASKRVGRPTRRDYSTVTSRIFGRSKSSSNMPGGGTGVSITSKS
ncbi:MAG: prephenate dehydrogenase dimerization domain-containing protein, partial [Planctomycetota bacterium]